MNPFSNTPIAISPSEFEKQVKLLLSGFDREISKFEILHDHNIKSNDGDYQIDIKVTFEFLGADFVILIECKRYKNSIKRETVQILNDKVINLGAHKGILVAASGFQSGAIEYAKSHGIALATVVKGEMTYETRSLNKENKIPDWVDIPDFVFLWIEDKENGSVGVTNLDSEYIKEFENKLFEN